MGRLLLIARLALRDLRYRPGQAVLLLLAITAATATLTLGLALNGVTSRPYLRTQAATNGADVTASVFPSGTHGTRPADLAALAARSLSPSPRCARTATPCPSRRRAVTRRRPRWTSRW
jgi:hypothetical protein